MGSHRTGGIIKFTIEPNLFYAAKSMTYNYNRTHITSSAFIPRPNKNYYVGSGSGTVVELPDSPKNDYLDKFIDINIDFSKDKTRAEIWNIKEKTCTNIFGTHEI
ncbi:hypothetical protein AAZR23_04505 [Morganella sp. Je.2.23]|uniref:hypothetical protein n=1 Tax=Morganella sp. Je.2.23 TaxID=3142840 RepID=UPI003DA99382